MQQKSWKSPLLLLWLIAVSIVFRPEAMLKERIMECDQIKWPTERWAAVAPPEERRRSRAIRAVAELFQEAAREVLGRKLRESRWPKLGLLRVFSCGWRYCRPAKMNRYACEDDYFFKERCESVLYVFYRNNLDHKRSLGHIVSWYKENWYPSKGRPFNQSLCIAYALV